jgi:hypothetical protein
VRNRLFRNSWNRGEAHLTRSERPRVLLSRNCRSYVLVTNGYGDSHSVSASG